MGIVLLLCIVSASRNWVEARMTEAPPAIDGIIEDLWRQADSAYDFVQCYPRDSTAPSDPTVVYVLQDRQNLYFAFRCPADRVEPYAQLGGSSDCVYIMLDPFNSRTTAYLFTIDLSGSYSDAMVLDDGRNTDNSWDGVWFFAVRRESTSYSVEIRIPFKSIRYDRAATTWGVDFGRYISRIREESYWTTVNPVEGHMVSRYGILKNVQPGSAGYYFELFPEIYLRNSRQSDHTGQSMRSTTIDYSVNLKWDVTSQTALNGTYHPDFAQIESDPFSLNLSQYETYLNERRPFFLEGQEIFRLSDFGSGKGFFKRLDLFYSRRIGKVVNEEPVPILGGGKLTIKAERVEAGGLAAFTEAQNEEPNRQFAAARIKYRPGPATEVGLLGTGMRADEDNYNCAVGLDASWRKGINQVIFQGALSNAAGKNGWAVSSGGFGFLGSFLTMGSILAVNDSFDVSGIGYVPWTGLTRFMAFTGPFATFNEGFIRNYWLGIGPILRRLSSDTTRWSTLVNFVVNPSFRNNWGFNLESCVGWLYEADTAFWSRSLTLSIWGNGVKYCTWFGGGYEYGYNYNRGFLAPNANTWFGVEYYGISRLGMMLETSTWLEWDTMGTVLAITAMATPRIWYMLTPTMKISLFNEMVFNIPETDIVAAVYSSNRVGFLFSWNFRPKSWLYAALNDYRLDNGGGLKLFNQVAAVKVKYLLQF